MTDTISRADAIDAICKEWCYVTYGNCPHVYDGFMCDGCDDVKVLESLPSAEPHNKDAISREGLLKSWEELSPRGRTEFDQVIMTIPALPSAEATQGKWIISDNGKYQTCSNCGIEMFHSNWNYCPMCGARMIQYKGGYEE